MGKKNIKKIGILNCGHIINFGSVLQSYAMEKIVMDITGRQAESIRYIQKKDIYYLIHYFPQIFDKGIAQFKMSGIKRKLYLNFFNRKLGKKCNEREKYFKRFVKKHFHLSPCYIGKKCLVREVESYDGFVLGSDQVWHPINLGSHFYTMEWIPEHIPKITYASSFGVSEISRRQQKQVGNYLNRIDKISVREQKGAEIIRGLTGRSVPVVADPTILLAEEHWKYLFETTTEKNYILCYFLGGNRAGREYAERLKEKTKMKILTIPFMDEINKIDFEFGDIQLFDIGPGEFLSYIYNADYIITDSFHGTVFSVLFKRQFVVFNRFAESEKRSTNSRIDTLLENLNLLSRRVTSSGEMDIELMDREIDYGSVSELLKIQRERSLDYLKKALETYDMV